MSKYLLAIFFGILTGLIMAGLVLLVDQQPRGHAVILLPTYTIEPLVVEVSGAVQNPGVYRLDRASRLQQAVEAAGGFTRDANGEAINMAAPIRDGEKIHVPIVGTQTIPELLEPGEIEEVATGSPDTIININTADEEELDKLPGIGPAKAKQICQYRLEHGFFDKIEDLMNVPGIGPATFELLKSLVTL